MATGDQKDIRTACWRLSRMVDARRGAVISAVLRVSKRVRYDLPTDSVR